MPRDIARATLYRGTINLWVEDELTRAYISEIWGDSSIAFFIGGGNGGVQAVVKDAESAGYNNVFGLIDKDYGPSNKNEWLNPQKTFRTFVLPVHEIENYLLYAAPLKQCRYHNLNRTVDQIEKFLVDAASRLCWWVACRDVVTQLRGRFHEGFIGDPSKSIADINEAHNHICESEWYKNLAHQLKLSAVPKIHTSLVKAHTVASGCLVDGTWRENFAGKEILRDVTSRICDQATSPRFSLRDADLYADLAKEVAAWQIANKMIPKTLVDLRNALKVRIERNLTPLVPPKSTPNRTKPHKP